MKNFFFLIFSLLCAPFASIAQESKVVNVYSWSNYIDPQIIKDFEKDTGIKVIYDTYDSNYVLESKLMVSNSGYDIVAPSVSPFLIRQAKIGLYEKLDKSKLTNYRHLDKKILAIMNKHHNSDDFAIPYSWNTCNIGYNIDKIKEKMPNAPLNSMALIFNPEIVKNFASCGVEFMDSPMEVIGMILAYHGKEPYSNSPEDLQFASKKLAEIRPYIKSINGARYIDNLANGESCLVFGYSGDILMARNRSKEANINVNIKMIYPDEGVDMGIDAMAILASAPNKENAYKFLDYLLKPEIAAKVTNYTTYATANKSSLKLVDRNILSDKAIILDISKLKNIYIATPASARYEKARTKVWLKFLSKN